MVAITDKLAKVGLPGTVTSLQAPGKAVAAASINIGSATNWPTDTAVYFAIRRVDPTLVTTANASGMVTGTYTEWKGTVSGTIISNLALQYGTDQVYAAGTNTQVYIVISAARENSLVDWGLTQHNQDGSHSAVTATSLTTTAAVTVGGALTVSGTISGITPAKFQNPYKFSAYRSSNQTIATATFVKVQCDTELFDTGSNYDNTTNYRFTAPVAGFYWISGRAQNNGNGDFFVSLYKNGSEVRDGTRAPIASGLAGSSVGDLLQLAANDYVELFAYSSANNTIVGTQITTYFSGYMVSAT